MSSARFLLGVGVTQTGIGSTLPPALGRPVRRQYATNERPKRPRGPGRCVVKVKASVKRICNQCQVIRRKGKVRVICKADPKHKQVQG